MNIMILVGHLILQDHVIKGPFDTRAEDHLPKFGGHRHSSSEDIMLLVCHVILT